MKKGSKHSKESKVKIGLSGLKRIPWNKGKKGIVKFSDATRKKMSDTQIRIGNKPPVMRGELNNLWKGGIMGEPYPKDWTDELKESIRIRDNYICKICGIHQSEIDNGQLKKLDIHHIDYIKENLDPKNLITLCRSCHSKTNIDINYWIEYFKNNNK